MVSLQCKTTKMAIMRRSKQMALNMKTSQMAPGTRSMLKATLLSRTPNNPTNAPMWTLIASWLRSLTTRLITSQKHSCSICSPRQFITWTLCFGHTSITTTRWDKTRLSRTSRPAATFWTSLLRIANKRYPISSQTKEESLQHGHTMISSCSLM